MIAHLVLFRPKPSLSREERGALLDALENALADIPEIRRAHVGRRVFAGRPYDEQNTEQFPFAAILEFDSEQDLRRYLDHPAHEELGRQFYLASERALVFDFDLASDARALLA